MNNSNEIENAQKIARSGKLRMCGFGEVWLYGYHPHHGGDLNKAADDLPRVLETGLCRLYVDEDGPFLGPMNPKYIAEDMDLNIEEDTPGSEGYLQ
jgi:hypothetical protein